MDPDLNIEIFSLARLKPDVRNARTHSRRQVRQIADSIHEFGFVSPVLVDELDRVIAGHGRLEAARLLELDCVPVIRLRHLTDSQKRALALADNKIAQSAGWNMELLAAELHHLCEVEVEVDFDVTVTGFAPAEIDLLIESMEPADADTKADVIPDAPSSNEIIVRRGDLWLLGSHRLLCGDATNTDDVGTLMAGDRAQMVFIDPPYNVRIDGNVCGSGRIRHPEFVMASGEMSAAEFTAFLMQALANLVASSIDGAIHFVCMDWRHVYELLTAGRDVYSELKNFCVWTKTNAGMGSFYRSQHELVLVFKNGTARHVNNVELGRFGRNRTNVWLYEGVNTFSPSRRDDLKLHPTVKPVALVADAIRDCSTRRGIVLDTFAGSGTTIIAAEKTGRRAYAMELDPRYVETTIRRWQDYAGGEAVHADTGLTFNALDQAAMRAREIGEAEHIEDRKPALPGRKGVSRAE